jgi:hypothetical protein
MRPNKTSAEMPFNGSLFAGQFVPEHFGGDRFHDVEIISNCQNRGIGI